MQDHFQEAARRAVEWAGGMRAWRMLDNRDQARRIYAALARVDGERAERSYSEAGTRSVHSAM
jgi:hypothetical protein